VDIATIIGVVGALTTILGAIFVGGGALMFVNIPSILIVFGGTLAVTFMKYSLQHTLSAFKIGLKAFLYKSDSPTELIKQGIDLAMLVRKEGVLALEKVEVQNEFLAKGLQLTADGHDPEFVARILSTDINLAIERHEEGQAIFKGIGDSAPAMGMIGTLIGLVQMMSNMEDPKSIGPAMAVALLTTLYGAILASAIALPIADKLGVRSAEEARKKQLVLDIINAIQIGMNPRVLEDLLKTYLPKSLRDYDPQEQPTAH
jgi:chemotaxis protein MotA